MGGKVKVNVEAKAKKLKALADGAVNEHERESAKKKLREHCKRHNLTDYDFADDSAKPRRFYINDDSEEILLKGICEAYLNKTTIKFLKNKDRREKRYVSVDLTDIQFLELQTQFAFYLSRLKMEIDDLLTAFLAKQKLYADPPPPPPQKERPFMEDMEQYFYENIEEIPEIHKNTEGGTFEPDNVKRDTETEHKRFQAFLERQKRLEKIHAMVGILPKYEYFKPLA